MNPPRVSVAIPLYNEEVLVPTLLSRVGAVLDRLPGGPHEMVLVDDGSSDGTLRELEAATRRDGRIVVVSLSRNFGHQAALTAALDHVTGDVTVVMDGDLQDEPEAIPDFVAKYLEGYDVVYAYRKKRKEPLWLRLCFAFFYRAIARVSSVELPLDAGDFALMSRRVVEQLRLAPERHRYLRGLRAWAGFQQTGIPVERAERIAGDSKYSLKSRLRFALDGIFAFTVVPLRMAAMLGLLAIVLSSLYALYAVYAKFVLERSTQGFTAIILVITFLSGVNLLFLGVLGAYVGRVYEEVKRRPLYVVERVLRKS